MYVFNLMVETLSTFFTMHVYSWNWIFYLNCIIWCYWIRRVVLMRRSWVEAQDDWVVILSYKMWAIRSVNRVYVDNLGLTGTVETLPKFCWKFWWNLYIYIYIKKKNLPEIFQCIAKKDVGKSRLLQLVSERGCDSVDFVSMKSTLNHVTWYRMNSICVCVCTWITTSVVIKESDTRLAKSR